MKRFLTLVISLSIFLVPIAGCSASAPLSQTPVAGENTLSGSPAVESVAMMSDSSDPNFLLLVSDEANDIGDFSELWVLISGVGFVLGDEEGIEETIFATPVEVNLVGLTAEAAVALWEGYLPEGDYTSVFLYVDEVWGIPTESSEPMEIKLPSNKLKLTMPVVVDGEETTEFVFDITVLRAGNSGQYILKPQITESGQGVTYRLLEQSSRSHSNRQAGLGRNGKRERQAGVGRQLRECRYGKRAGNQLSRVGIQARLGGHSRLGARWRSGRGQRHHPWKANWCRASRRRRSTRVG